MDEIIWSSESLQLIVSTLRGTSNEMETEIASLRHCRNEVPLALRDGDGTFLEDVLDQMSHAIQKLTDAAERASDLAQAIHLTDTMFEETEQAVRRQYESTAVSAGGDEAGRRVSWAASAQVAVVPGLAERTIMFPGWLSLLADQYFQFPDYSGDL